MCQIEILAVQVVGPTFLGTDFAEHRLHQLRLNRSVSNRLKRAGDPGLGWQADRQVKVGSALFEHDAEKLIDNSHGTFNVDSLRAFGAADADTKGSAGGPHRKVRARRRRRRSTRPEAS